MVLSRDVTARRVAERRIGELRGAALEAERDRVFRTLFDASPVAMAYVRGERIESANAQCASLFGLTLERMHSLTVWWHLAYPDALERTAAQQDWEVAIRETGSGDGTFRLRERRVRCADGRRLDLMVAGLDARWAFWGSRDRNGWERLFTYVHGRGGVTLWSLGAGGFSALGRAPWWRGWAIVAAWTPTPRIRLPRYSSTSSAIARCRSP